MQSAMKTEQSAQKVLITGATGFIGTTLLSSLYARGYPIVATSRNKQDSSKEGIEWRSCDLLRPETLPGMFEDVKIAYYLVHSMGGSHDNFRELERRTAKVFADAAAKAGVKRIVYLGGPAPKGTPSEHLKSRLEVGEILRDGEVPTVELRASMVIGYGSASWQIVRDLALRLPFMILPSWLRSRTRPVSLDDVIAALVAAAELPIRESVWFDIPGPDILSGRQILEYIAALQGRRIYAIEVPFLTPKLSALWLKLVTRADFNLARELVLGFREDLLPEGAHFWKEINHTELLSFDQAASQALDAEGDDFGLWEKLINFSRSRKYRA